MSGAAVTAEAPTRIDLAGGTLDIWPLNLFFGEAVTLNMAISIRARATVSPRDDGKVILVSEDRGRTARFPSVEEITHNHPLGMLSRLAAHFLEKGMGADIVTRSDAPAGAGLAGSSSLNIALCGALARFTGKKLSKEKLIDTARDIEAALLGVPTGLQDYGAAVFGGVNAFSFPPGGMRREKLGKQGAELSRRILLFYSGQSRNSGANNWEMFKRVIDGDQRAKRRFEIIAECARAAAGSLGEGDFKSFDEAVGDEWKARKGLFPSISTPVIDSAIREGTRAGATAARICGAGGGGCFILITPPEKREAVVQAVTRLGPRRLEFTLSKSGLRFYNPR